VALFYFVYTNAHMLMQHTAGCTAMHCPQCKATFCLYCRTTFVDSKNGKATDACHNHIFECEKRPMRTSVCTESVLFPAHEEDKDFITCYQNCHKLDVLQRLVCGNWSALEIRRLVQNTNFQALLLHLKDRQTHYRCKYSEKPELLRFCFIKTIGATEAFKFELGKPYPNWVSDYSEEEELRMKLRSEAKAAAEAEMKAAKEARAKEVGGATKLANAILRMKSMGFDETAATVALEATGGDLDSAVALLLM
jgi:hypothetical protein